MMHPSNEISLASRGGAQEGHGSSVRSADPEIGGMQRTSRKFAAALNDGSRGRCLRSSICGFWIVLAVAGLILVKKFQSELKTDVPPSRGTPSYAAKKVYDKYFPAEPIQGAFLVRSKDLSPLLAWGNSTCAFPEWVAACSQDIKDKGLDGIAKCVTDYFPPKDGTIDLKLVCYNASALGGGCITKTDVETQFAFALTILNQTAPSYYEKILDSLPSQCPKRTVLTEDWLRFTGRLRSRVQKNFPEYNHTVLSFGSIPPNKSFQGRVNVSTIPKVGPILGPILKNLNVTYMNFSFSVPGGEFWELIRDKLLADRDSTSLVAVQLSVKHGVQPEPTSPEAKEIGATFVRMEKGAPYTLQAQASSLGSMMDTIQKGIDAAMDISAMTTPVALLILAAMVRNLRLLLLTIANLVTTILVAILLMYPYVLSMTTSTVTPALMIAVALAMSIDYSLFLMRRFTKEIALGREVPEAVAIMLATSGRIILTSGITLLFCFLAMLTLPVAFIFSMGVAAAVTVFMAVVVSLTMTPTLLISFPRFFSSNRQWGLSFDGCCCDRRSARAAVSVAPAESDAADAIPKKSCWIGFGTQVQRGAIVVTLALLAGMIPVAVTSLPRFKHSVGVIPLMPTNAAATHTVYALQDAFGVGSVFPTQLIVVPPNGATSNASKREAWLQKSCVALQELADLVAPKLDSTLPRFTAAAFSGDMILNGKCSNGLSPLGAGKWSNEGHPYSATVVTISYPIDPFSTQGGVWIEALRDGTQEQSISEVADWYVYGVAPIQMDVANLTFGRLPLMVGVMMAIVFIVIAVSFKSIVAPIRAVFCLTWMLVITFGLAIYTFQDGMLDAFGAAQIGKRPGGAMCWMAPAMAISVMVGLGLDYDIFFTERVIEEWEHGFSEKEAASRALGDTANTITAAGVIMVVAFCSLLICHIPILNEISFLLIVGIIIDCFVTTKVIIPCAMALLGRANFWPRKDQAKQEPSANDMHTGLVSDQLA